MKKKTHLTQKQRTIGPDFLGNSCSNTLRSSCSQLKWPLIRQNKTTNQCYCHTPKNLGYLWTHHCFCACCNRSHIHFSPLPFSPSPTEKKPAGTACHPSNPARPVQQHLTQILLHSFAVSHSHSLLFPNTASLSTERSTHHRFSPALLTDYSVCYNHVNAKEQGVSFARHQEVHGIKQARQHKGRGNVCLQVNHLYVCMSGSVICCGASVLRGHQTQ